MAKVASNAFDLIKDRVKEAVIRQDRDRREEAPVDPSELKAQCKRLGYFLNADDLHCFHVGIDMHPDAWRRRSRMHSCLKGCTWCARCNSYSPQTLSEFLETMCSLDDRTYITIELNLALNDAAVEHLRSQHYQTISAFNVHVDSATFSEVATHRDINFGLAPRIWVRVIHGWTVRDSFVATARHPLFCWATGPIAYDRTADGIHIEVYSAATDHADPKKDTLVGRAWVSQDGLVPFPHDICFPAYKALSLGQHVGFITVSLEGAMQIVRMSEGCTCCGAPMACGGVPRCVSFRVQRKRIARDVVGCCRDCLPYCCCVTSVIGIIGVALVALLKPKSVL